MRKVKLTGDIAVRIAEHVKSGLNWTDSALLEGAPRAVFQEWMAKAEAKPKSAYGALRRLLQTAEDDTKAEMLEQVIESARKGDRSSQGWLKDRGYTY